MKIFPNSCTHRPVQIVTGGELEDPEEALIAAPGAYRLIRRLGYRCCSRSVFGMPGGGVGDPEEISIGPSGGNSVSFVQPRAALDGTPDLFYENPRLTGACSISNS